MYHLVDLYEGNTKATFDTTVELVAYLKEEGERGNFRWRRKIRYL